MKVQSLADIVAFFEGFAPADIQRLTAFYTDDARFKDPFNEVQGIAAIERVFAHMFDTLDEPRFTITRQMAEGNEYWLAWDFHFSFRSIRRGQPQVVHGASHLVLAADGRIATHRDYWDAAEELYEKIPVIGTFMRWLKRRASS